jgi:hypothetical protein
MDVMGEKKAAVLGILGELRHREVIGPTAFAASLLGLLALWNGHFRNLLQTGYSSARCAQEALRQEIIVKIKKADPAIRSPPLFAKLMQGFPGNFQRRQKR